MRECGFGTSWQGKTSMVSAAILIAQRLQVPILLSMSQLTKVVERHRGSCASGDHENSYSYRRESVAHGQSEVHPGFAVGFHRGRDIEQGEWYFLA
jgi:hypothetical protein